MGNFFRKHQRAIILVMLFAFLATLCPAVLTLF